MVLVEADKVKTEVPCPVARTVVKLRVAEDAEVFTGEVICAIET